MLRMTEEEYEEYINRRKTMNSHIPPPPPEKAKVNKHRNQKVYIYEDNFASYEKIKGHGNIKETFDSVKEFTRAGELRFLEKQQIIHHLERQKVFLIQDTFKNKEGTTIQKITYKADFFYEDENGDWIVEDVKGFDEKKQKFLTTEAFRLKWKLLQAKYPQYKFQLY